MDSQCTACAVRGTPSRSKTDVSEMLVVGDPPDDEISIYDEDGGEYIYTFKEYVEDDGEDLYDEEDLDAEYDYEDDDDEEEDGDGDDYEEVQGDQEVTAKDGTDDRVIMYIHGIQDGFDPISGRCKNKYGAYIKCPE